MRRRIEDPIRRSHGASSIHGSIHTLPGVRIMKRILLVSCVVIALNLALAAPALAVAPTNDERSAATVVPGIPYSDSVSTVDATTASDDPDCVGQGPTVWYSFTPSDSVFIGANTFGSDYDTTLSAYVQDGADLVQIACNDDAGGSLQSRVRFEAEAGVTYFFMVGAFASGPGGNLTFSVLQAPPPVQIALAVDPTGTASRTGVATISGTITCSGPAEVFIDTTLRQRVGRRSIDGFGSTVVACDGSTSWSMEVASSNGKYAGGRADAQVFAFAPDDESFDFVSAAVRLRVSR